MKKQGTSVMNCVNLLREAQSVAVLSGAGVSTSAGIPDFRGPNGIYRRQYDVDPERIFDIDFFLEAPSFFYRFHREFLTALEKITPTYTHRFLAALERDGKLKGIVTQNIDALHQQAGSQSVLEIHGGVWSSRCISCGQSYDYKTSYKMTMAEEVPHCCGCGGVIKPNIVFFGEAVMHLNECQSLMHKADLLLVLGSSLTVAPAAILPSLCKGSIIVVNKGYVSPAYLAPDRIDIRIDGDLDEFFQELNTELQLGIQ
ncbi:MAG: RNA polymerase subunit sigma [Dethiosulfovibrio peptidovorans]|nr:MAG: RNA polymerase subunit sigma [Dethiosulfovibrio peptidovorans]